MWTCRKFSDFFHPFGVGEGSDDIMCDPSLSKMAENFRALVAVPNVQKSRISNVHKTRTVPNAQKSRMPNVQKSRRDAECAKTLHAECAKIPHARYESFCPPKNRSLSQWSLDEGWWRMRKGGGSGVSARTHICWRRCLSSGRQL